MNRVAYVRLGPGNVIVETGQTDEPAFDALAPLGLVRIPLGVAAPLGWVYDPDAETAFPAEEEADAE